MSCGKGFSLFVKFCVWICQWERCPTAQPHACAPWMSQQFLSGLRAWWSALNGTGLLLCVLVWLRQDQMKGFEERLSGYDTPAKGAALRLSTVFSKGILYNVWGLWFFWEKWHLRKKERERQRHISPLVKHPIWQSMEVFLHLLCKIIFVCWDVRESSNHPPFLWEGNGSHKETPASWVETDGTKHMGTSYVYYFTVTWLAFCFSIASPDLLA